MSMSDKLFGTYTQRNKKRINDTVKEICSLEDKYKSMSNSELSSQTDIFRKRLKNGETEKDIMVEAFAVCREATRRCLGMFHYEVQLSSAVAMQDNCISEMKTGEGKTLVQILVAYLNAISGKGVHVMTSNDYLTERDCKENSKVYEFLGLSCGFVPENRTRKISREEKQKLYACDIVYTKASTVGFDYLNDNLVKDEKDRYIKRPFNFAIIDEVDSILLDEASTAMILSSNKKDSSDPLDNKNLCKWAGDFIKKYDCKVVSQKVNVEGMTYTGSILFLDEKEVMLSTRMISDIEKFIPNFDNKDYDDLYELGLRQNAVVNAILAEYAYHKDVDYVIEEKNGKEISIIDKNTGRVATGKRLSKGLHEALEAKEDVPIKASNVVTARCTFPDFFSMYSSGICGMTGTSNIEAFKDLYYLETYEVPSRKPNIRIDYEDEVYLTKNAKYRAIINEVISCHDKLQPVLIGTDSIEESEMVSKLLNEAGIRHQLLNAVKNENEAGIVKSAGLLGKVTVTTNMAGRGTDIKLGEGVLEVGGLHVISTTYNKSERIDNQLRGRAARQGDPGSSKCFVSLEDEIVLENDSMLAISPKVTYLKQTNPYDRITNESICKKVKMCQAKKESKDAENRKFEEEFGKILTEQKNIFYSQRDKMLKSKTVSEALTGVIDNYSSLLSTKTKNEVIALIGQYVPSTAIEQCDFSNPIKLKEQLSYLFKGRINFLETSNQINNYAFKAKSKMLSVLDDYYIDMLNRLTQDRVSAGLNAYAGRNIFDEYRTYAYEIASSATPYIQNELLAYALRPTLRYGAYLPNFTLSSEEKGVVL